MNLFSRLARVVESWLTSAESNFDYSKSDDKYSDEYSGFAQQDSSSINPKIAEFYANLEVPYGSDLETVKTAWKKMMRRYHPDLHASDTEKRQTAEILTQRLNTAYEELSKYLKNSKI